MKADTEYCANLDCYITHYKLRGFDIYKYHAKRLTTTWEVWWPLWLRDGRCFWSNDIESIRRWTKEHEKELKK